MTTTERTSKRKKRVTYLNGRRVLTHEELREKMLTESIPQRYAREIRNLKIIIALAIITLQILYVPIFSAIWTLASLQDDRIYSVETEYYTHQASPGYNEAVNKMENYVKNNAYGSMMYRLYHEHIIYFLFVISFYAGAILFLLYIYDKMKKQYIRECKKDINRWKKM